MMSLRMAIVGAGSVGLLTAAYSARKGHEVLVVTRTVKQADELCQNGVQCTKNDGSFTSYVQALCSGGISVLHADVIIVAVKQTAVAEVLEWGKSAFDKHTPVIMVQNGMGHVEQARQTLSSPVIAGVVTHGALKTSFTSVTHTGRGEMITGGASAEKQLIGGLLTSDYDFPVRWDPEINYAMRRKLLVNAVINPLTTVHQVKNGELLKRKELAYEAENLFHEAADVLELDRREWDYVVKVMELTAENTSSMLQDYLNSKKSESDAITGYLIEQARRTDKKASFLTKIHNQIKRLEGERDG